MAEPVQPSTKEASEIKALDIPATAVVPSAAEPSPSPIQLHELAPEGPSVPVQDEHPVKVKLSWKKKRLIRMVKGAAGIKSKPNPFLPENSLSAIERYFHHMPKESAQVLLFTSHVY